MFKSRIFLLAFMVMLLGALAACGGGSAGEVGVTPEAATADGGSANDGGVTPEAATDAPEATAVPAPTDAPEPTATAEPAPAVALDDAVRVDEGGFAFQPPAGFAVEALGGLVQVSEPDGDPDLGARIMLAGGPPTGLAPEEMLAGFSAEMAETDGVAVTEPVAVTVAGLTGVSADFSAPEGDATILGRIIALAGADQSLVVFGGAEAGAWADGFAATFDAVVGTLDFFAPSAGAPAQDDADTSADSGGGAALPTGSSDAAAGPACFGTTGQGMTCLSADGQWNSYTRETSDLGGDFIAALATCPDGAIAIAHSSGIDLFDGATFRSFDSGWGFSSAEAVVCSGTDQFWVAHFEGVSAFDGTSWTTYAAEGDLSTGAAASSLVYDVAVDGQGTVWVVTANTIAAFDGSGWTRYQPDDGLDDTYFFDGLMIDPAGRPWALHSDGLLQFDGAGWAAIDNPSFFSAEAAAVDSAGQVWVASRSDGLYVFDGAAWSRYGLDNSDLATDDLRAVAIDAGGRLWVGTAYGLNVLADGQWVHYEMDSADLVNNEFASIAVVGGGPALPAPQDKPNGSLTGSVIQDGTPVSDARVEVCVQKLYSRFDGDTPCSDQPLFFQTVTDADGAFTFDDLPVGLYVLVIETDGGWAQLTNDFGIASELVPVDAGDVTDIGELLLSDE